MWYKTNISNWKLWKLFIVDFGGARPNFLEVDPFLKYFGTVWGSKTYFIQLDTFNCVGWHNTINYSLDIDMIT